jgi:hypothetical protein
MVDKTKEYGQENCSPVSNIDAAIRHFHDSLADGRHWYVALLETIGLWTDETENVGGKPYLYLIGGEAFDWLLLAERLCETANGRIPEKERFDLLFECRPPLHIPTEEFKSLIGISKYHQLLNFFYGVTVEQALVQAVREEVRKERHSNGLSYRRDEESEAFIRIYGENEIDLLKQFRREKRYPLNSGSSLTEMKEFAYWCFKYRVRICEKAKVASDTQKALQWLKRYGIFSN